MNTPFEPKDSEIFFKIKDKDDNELEKFVETTLLAKLLVDEVLFVGNFDTGPFFESQQTPSDITTCVWVNCNDLFAWGCADCEPVETKELPELYRAHKSGNWGVAKWCCKRRNLQATKAYR